VADDGLTELAKLFKERDSKTPPSISTGIVISPPPEPKIRLNDVVVLGKDQLIFAAGMLSRDTVVEGDEVIVIPVMDSQMYYVIDKAVKFE